MFVLPQLFLHTLAELLFGPLHQIACPVVGNIERLADLDAAGIVGEPHLQRCLSAPGERGQAFSQCLDGQITRQVFSCPAIPNFIQDVRLRQRLDPSLLSVQRDEQVVRGASQVARSCCIIMLNEIFAAKDSQKRVLRQIIGCGVIASQHAEVSPDPMLMARNQLSRLQFRRAGCWRHNVAMAMQLGPGPGIGRLTLRSVRLGHLVTP